MPIVRDFVAYHRSIADELAATKNRIRDLIGDSHWLSDGEQKEIILRKVLKAHLPGNYRVGKGFICCPDRTSDQIDVLITNKKHPTIFKEGDLVIVTPDCVEAIIEVKTEVGSLRNVLDKLAENVELVRKERPGKCWAGLFAFDEKGRERKADYLLSYLQEVTHYYQHHRTDEIPDRTINCVALGPQIFSRFWKRNELVENQNNNPIWHSYIFPIKGNANNSMRGIAHAYFISNLVWALSPDADPNMKFAWFPAENGKREFRHSRIGLDGLVQRFNN